MFKQEITKIKNLIQERLEKFFAGKIKEAKRIDPIIGKTAQYLADQTLNGGKRIRAALAVQGYLAGGGKLNPAILAGDISSVWAYELFARSNFPSEQKLEALNEMNRMIFKCGAGEILDVALELKNNPKENDIFKVQIYKTASYPIEGPLT